MDIYTETKILAEKAVLEANGQAGLLTTALRPDGVYGSDSNVMLDRLYEQLVTGMFVATIGGAGATHDHIYIDNLVHAELLAAQHLVRESPVCGRAHSVGDGRPMPMFEFFRPMTEALGHQMPKIDLAAKPVMLAMRAWQYLHFKLGVPRPLFTPHELAKLTISHCGTNEEVARDFGYEPLVSADEAMGRCIDYYQRKLVADAAHSDGFTSQVGRQAEQQVSSRSHAPAWRWPRVDRGRRPCNDCPQAQDLRGLASGVAGNCPESWFIRRHDLCVVGR